MARMPLTPVARHLRHTIATSVRAQRERIGWSQDELASRAGTSRSMVAMVESGAVNVTVDMVGRLLTPLGLTAQLLTGSLLVEGRQRDAVHAWCVGHGRRRLEASDWPTRGEVEIVERRARGFIDILAYEPRRHVLLVVEVKTELRDVGELERTLNWYARAAPAAARRFGWTTRHVQGVVLLLATEANDARVSENRALLNAAFPVRARQLQAFLGGGGLPGGLGIAMVDPGSKRRGWLRPTTIDGRRSRAPYADYADVMRRRLAARQSQRR